MAIDLKATAGLGLVPGRSLVNAQAPPRYGGVVMGTLFHPTGLLGSASLGVAVRPTTGTVETRRLSQDTEQQVGSFEFWANWLTAAIGAGYRLRSGDFSAEFRLEGILEFSRVGAERAGERAASRYVQGGARVSLGGCWMFSRLFGVVADAGAARIDPRTRVTVLDAHEVAVAPNWIYGATAGLRLQLY
jgi:hypothetical protein